MRSHHKANRYHFELLESRRLLSFAAPLAFDTASSPACVAVGDVNGDGRVDVVTANAGGGGTVSVLLGNGDGSFQPQRTFGPGSSPRSVALGDVNGDGLLDLAVATPFSDTVSVLVGNGDGTFQDARTFPAGFSPIFVAVGHFNGDGFLDLAVANSDFDGAVSVLLSNGNGTFQPPHTFASGGSVPTSVAVGDVNGDGRLDLAVGNQGYFGSGEGVSVLLSNGDGTFQAARHVPAGREPRSVAVVDVNGDGRLDLAVASYLGNTGVSVLLGNGDGTFQARRTFPAGNEARSIAVADVNGDGRLDLAVANVLSENVSVLLGNGDGTFQAARNYHPGSRPESVAVADINGDGWLDLAVANQGGSNVSVLVGNGDGSFRAAPNFAAGPSPWSVAVGEFNGDARLDLAVLNVANGGAVSMLVGNVDGTFQAPRTIPLGTSPHSVAAGDVNGDGRLDLAVANGVGTVSVLVGNGDGSFQAPRTFPAGAVSTSVAVEDVNGDGFLDLAVVNRGTYGDYTDSSVSVLLGNGDGTFQTARHFPAGAFPTSVAVGEFNGDGRPDLAVVDDESSLVNMGVLLGNGDGTFQAPRHFSAGENPTSVAVGDVNGDGRLDLAVTNMILGGAVSVLLGNGDGTFQAARHFTAGRAWWPNWPGPTSVKVADVSGDGRLDLVVTSSGTVRVLLGNGDGNFQTTHVSYVAGITPLAAGVADFNGDGRPDLTTANQLSDDVSTLLNDGIWATKTWIGPGGTGSGGNWSNAANWSPSGVPTASHAVAISGKSVNLSASATVASLTLTGGASLAVASNGNRVLRTSSLAISFDSALNLNDNDLIIDYASVSQMTSTVVNLLARRGSAPTGIYSSQANASGDRHTLGVAEASDVFGISGSQTATFSGQPVDATSILIKFSYLGDANLDGLIDADDFANIDFGAQTAGARGYFYGDFNLDGEINADDYALIDFNFNDQEEPL